VSVEVEVPTAAVSRTTLHGHSISYVDVGSGPVLVLLHGLLGSHEHWAPAVDELARTNRVIAPDLIGHGTSAKPVGDYSLGAHAATVRDLLDQLEIERVTIVGHSLGGGISLQFAYLFPGRAERLVLVSSGGLGRELGLSLRAATLPGAELVLPLISSAWVRQRGDDLGRQLARLGLRPGRDVAEAWAGLASLSDADSRRAFLGTARAVIDVGGQSVSAGDRLPRLGAIPTLIVWGARDRVIPSWHAVVAHEAIPGSQLEIFEGSGHFPQLDDPERFVRVVRRFVAGNPRRRSR